MNDEMVEVTIHQQLCSGCQTCVELAPKIFEASAETRAPRILRSPCPESAVRQAVLYCPEQCIEIY